MGFLADAIARKSSSSLDIFREIYGSMWSTKTGTTVNLDTAIRVATVFACSRVIGNGMAQVPLKLMRLDKDGTRKPAVDHPLYRLFARRPNNLQTSFEFRTTMSWHLELAGRFVAFKIAPAGVIRELIPLEPEKLKITQKDDLTLKYEYSAADGQTRELPAASVWHVRGPSWNSWDGLRTLQVARDAIGLAIALEDSQAGLHKHGVQTTGAWSVEGKLNPGQHQELSDWIQRWHGGAKNAGKPFIMDRAAKWVQQAMTGVDAQTLESRKEQIAEICRFFGVNSIMAGYSDKAATYASAEQMFMAHRENCLAPRWAMYEQSMDANLLTEKEFDQGYYFDFVEEGLIRGSVKDTVDAIGKLVTVYGLFTANEGRALFDRNPDADPASDKLRIPVNTSQKPEPDAGDVKDSPPA